MKIFTRHLVLASVLSFFAVLLSAPAHASGALTQRIINPAGGTNASDGIRVYIGSNSQVQVVGYSDLTGSPGVYPQMFAGCITSGCTNYGTPTLGNMFNSVVLRIEPAGGGAARAIYANTDYGISGSTTFTQTSQSAITGAGTSADPFKVVTTLNPPSPDNGITVTLTDTYIYPDPYFSRAIDLTGLPTGERVKLYWVIDTYLAGGDNGNGTSQTNASNTSGIPDFVGVTKPGVLQGIQSSSGSPLWNRYFSGSTYSVPFVSIGSTSGDLMNVISSALGDNAIAVQWNVPPGHTSFSVRTGQTYASSAQVSEAFVPDAINVGGSSVLHFDFQNFDTGSALISASASYAIPAGVTLVSTAPASNSCVGSSVSVTGGQIMFSSIDLNTATDPSTPYVCTITFNVTSNVVGSHIGSITPGSSAISAGTSGHETLVVSGGLGAPPPNLSSHTPIPVMKPWGLLLMTTLLGFGALLMHRRRMV